MDMIIRQARLVSGEFVDIAIEDGYIAKLEPELEQSARQEKAAHGRLVLPAFVNGQLHACKVFWRRKLAKLPPADAQQRFALAKEVKASYTPEDVFERVSETIRLAIASGSCAIRLFADVDAASGLKALKGLLKVKETFASLITVQVVAFPQDGVFAGDTETLMQEALELGADVVGGIPWIEQDQASQKAHSDMCFALAKRSGKDLHFVCDDTTDPNSQTLEYVAQKTLQENYLGRVSATQCAALSFYEDAYAAKVIEKLKAADMTVFSNPHVSLVTTAFDKVPYPRGVTRIHELLAAAVPVATAQDDIDNWYYPFGRNDMLEVAQFMTHTAGFAWQPEQVLPMVTHVPAQVLGLTEYGLAAGKAANLVLFDAQSWHEALQFQVAREVFLRGRLVAKLERNCKLFALE